MTRRFLALAFAVVVALPLNTSAGEPQLSHNVYFKLREGSEKSAAQLMAGCREYLSGHEGSLYFSVGTRAKELTREVNDKDFDVSLIVVFCDQAAHDKYQTHPRHLKFIEENKDLWDSVRVFDSLLPAPEGETTETSQIKLPDLAAQFAGMISGTVAELRDGEVVIKVSGVPKKWQQSRAKNADALVGKLVLVGAGENERAGRLLKSLHIGETVTLDVAHKKGETLTILELTQDQRERVK